MLKNTSIALKHQAAEAALSYVKPGEIIGVGTGSTVNFFVDALAEIKNKIEGAVSSSKTTCERLKSKGILVIEPNEASEISVYVDGADEINDHLEMIKGGGGALTGEKIIAALSKQFICIADESKFVKVLGTFPLPIEVIPLARSYVARELVKMGGRPVYREHLVTDYGNVILDTSGLDFKNPRELESLLNQISGVVTNGIFARRKADVLLLGTAKGVQTILAK